MQGHTKLDKDKKDKHEKRHNTKGLVIKTKSSKSTSWRDIDSQNLSTTNLILGMLLQEHKWSHDKRNRMHQVENHDPTSSKAMGSWRGERREHGRYRLASCVMLGDPWEEEQERPWNPYARKLCYSRWSMRTWYSQDNKLCYVMWFM